MKQIKPELKILICDDMPAVIDCMVYCINQVSPEIKEIKQVNSGIEALEILKKDHYDILICDVETIDISGFQIIESLGETLNPKIRKMIVSAHKSKEEVQRAVSLKVRGYVLKPFDNNDFERNFEILLK